MKLQISNFAKIKCADISINGITVIAGNNNTGKSTIGKILCSIFDSMANIEESLKQARFRSINRELRNYVMQNLETDDSRFARPRSLFDYVSNFSNDLIFGEGKDYEILLSNFINSVNSLRKKDVNSFTDKNIQEIRLITQNILKVSDETLMKSVLTMYFQDVFNEQINNIESPAEKAEIKLNIKQKTVELIFKDDAVESLSSNIVFTNSATYIDNPFVIDRLNERIHYFSDAYSLLQDLLDKLRLKSKEFQYEDEALNKEIVSDKLKSVFEKMSEIVPGEMIYDNRYKYVYKKGVKPIDVNSLSTGLKSFVLLKQLLLNSSLKEKDVLVLDEPEIHLHPEWQLRYAEIIILLQKAFNLNIVITTHSSHFLEALDLFATIHENKDVCNYYLVQLNDENGKSEFIDATENIEKIYSNLVSPSLALDSIREKVGLNDE